MALKRTVKPSKKSKDVAEAQAEAVRVAQTKQQKAAERKKKAEDKKKAGVGALKKKLKTKKMADAELDSTKDESDHVEVVKKPDDASNVDIK
jgi:hypothetical protein